MFLDFQKAQKSSLASVSLPEGAQKIIKNRVEIAGQLFR